MELFTISNMSSIVMVIGLCFLVGSGIADVPMFSNITNPVIKGGKRQTNTRKIVKKNK